MKEEQENIGKSQAKLLGMKNITAEIRTQCMA